MHHAAQLPYTDLTAAVARAVSRIALWNWFQRQRYRRETERAKGGDAPLTGLHPPRLLVGEGDALQDDGPALTAQPMSGATCRPPAWQYPTAALRLGPVVACRGMQQGF